MTVILITHFMDEAIHADRLLVIDEGKIHLEGTPREVFSNVEAMQKIGLDVPEVTKLASALKASGLAIDDQIITNEEMVAALCQLK